VNEYYEQTVQDFTNYLTRLNYAQGSIKSRTRQLYRFLQYMDKHYIYRLTDITTDYLNDYNNQLHQKTIKTKTIQAYISVLKLFNEYLERYGEAPIITTRLDITKEISTPRNILTKEQINVLYESSDK